MARTGRGRGPALLALLLALVASPGLAGTAAGDELAEWDGTWTEVRVDDSGLFTGETGDDTHAPTSAGGARDRGTSGTGARTPSADHRVDDSEPDTVFGACGVVVLDDADGTVRQVGAEKLPVTRAGDRLLVPVATPDGLAIHARDDLGRVDRTYGQRGIATVDLPADAEPFTPVRVLGRPDGSLLVLQETDGAGDDPTDLLVAEIPADGDPAGVTTTTVDVGTGDELTAAAVAGDDAVLLAVTIDEHGPVVARLVGDALDPTYGSDGLTPLLSGRGLLAATPDGGAVVADALGEGVWRLTSDGDPDPAFGTDGMATSPLPHHTDLAVGGDGNVWLVTVREQAVSVARLDDTGTVAAGPETLAPAAASFRGARVTLGARTWVGWDLPSGSEPDRGQAVVALRDDLTPDPTFGDAGTYTWTTWLGRLSGLLAEDGTILLHSGPELRRLRGDGTLDGPCPPDDVGVVRYAGADRFATAAALSRAAFPTADTAVVATGLTFPDALAGGPVAARERAPLLLVTRDTVPGPTRDELARLAPERILLLGGTATISAAVATELGRTATVERIAGDGRYATAARLAATFDPTEVDRVYLATGLSFPDALAVGPWAGARGAPIVLTDPNVLPAVSAQVLDRLAPREIVVVGGRAAVSDPVVDEIVRRHPGASVVRVAGADRFATARQILLFETYDGGTVTLSDPVLEIAHVATGLSFPDALAAGPVAALEDAGLVLSAAAELSENARDALSVGAPQRVTVLGGTSALSGAVSDRLTGDELGHRFLSYSQAGIPLGWNRCSPVPWVFNPADAPDPDAAEALLIAAFDRVEQDVGLDFVYEGRTDEPLPDPRSGTARGPYVPRYGQRWAPVLVGWGTPYSGGAVGEATSIAVTEDGYVSGTIVFHRDASFPLDFTEVSWGMVALHEIGHLVGLAHVPSEHVMYPAIGRHPLTDLTSADRLGMRRATGDGCRSTPLFPG